MNKLRLLTTILLILAFNSNNLNIYILNKKGVVMKKLFFTAFILILTGFSSLYSQTTGLKSLYKLSDSKTRSISPENFTGEKGKGGMATLEEGSAAKAARKLGQGWKVNPYIHIQPGGQPIGRPPSMCK